jgi:hypothetical protein
MFCLSGIRVQAQETRSVTTTVGIDACSAYVFHGMTYNKGFVLQPFLNIAGKRFVYTLWNNFNLQSDDNGLGHFPAGEFTEIDHFLSYLLPVSVVDLDVTLGVYNYPKLNWAADKEIQVGAQKTLSPLLTPFARGGYMYGGDMQKNLYVEFGVKGEQPLRKNLLAGYQLKGSWEHQGFAPGTPTGMKEFLGIAGLTWLLRDDVGVTAKVNYVGRLNKKVLTNELYGVKWFASLGVFTTF